ncbi:mitochondrial inner membrane protein COX18-like, partial [Tropilaelaps mercedesae]
MYRTLSCRIMAPVWRYNSLVTKLKRIALPKRFNSDAVVLSSCSLQQKRSLSCQTWYDDICQSEIVKAAENTLINVHDTVGLSWWCCILTSTIILRTVITLPLAIYSHHVLARLANLGPEAKELNRLLQAETALAKQKLNLSQKDAIALYKYSLKKRISELTERENCHPAKATITTFAQVPLWISFSLAIRNISESSFKGAYALQSFQYEGFLQISNLALPDPIYVVPVLVCIINLVNIELYCLRSNMPQFGWNRALTNGLRLATVMLLPVAAIAPSGVTLYWLGSALTAITQNLLLMSPRFRRACRIPQTEKE